MSDDSSIATLVESLRGLVSRLSPGDRLPSSRELVEAHRVSPVTVSRAIARLATEGVVVTRPGSGTYAAPRNGSGNAVADTSWQTLALTDRTVDIGPITDALGTPSEGTILLDGGYLHRSLQPTALLGSAMTRAARRPEIWDRAPNNGLASLRAVFAGAVGPDVTADDVLITAGGQSALSMAFRAIAGPGSPILVESPTYPGAIAAARAAGLRPVPVPTDDNGIRPDLLAEAFAMTGARLLYLQPTFQNPTGAVLARERRRDVVDVARDVGAFVVEDDFARRLGHGSGPAGVSGNSGSAARAEWPPRPLAADDRDGAVVYLTSLTKPAAPSLRIGALVARGPVMERMRALRRVDDFFVTRPLQEAALDVVSSAAWRRHLKVLSAGLSERCAVAVSALARECPDWTVTRVPSGGLHLWIRLKPDDDDLAIARAARDHGVAVSPGRTFYSAEPPTPCLRLGFAATADVAELVEGIRRLGLAAAGSRDGRRRPRVSDPAP